MLKVINTVVKACENVQKGKYALKNCGPAMQHCGIDIAIVERHPEQSEICLFHIKTAHKLATGLNENSQSLVQAGLEG